LAHPSVEPGRRHGPRGYADYRACKPWLRDEFTFRCIYCLTRERWYPSGHEEFGVDHVKPVSAAADLIVDYDNLLYACSSCNRNRQAADLASKRPPGGNTRPNGLNQSCFEQRKRGERPDVY